MRHRLILTAFLILPALSLAAQQQRSSDTVAVVAGQAVSAAEVDASIQEKLYALEQQKYALRKSALNNIIAARVLAAEAGRRGVSVEKLRAALMEGAAPVTSADIDAAYADMGAGMQAWNADEARERLRLDLQARRQIERLRAEVERLQNGAAVETFLEEPRLPTATNRADDAPFLGPKNAPVTLTMFSDFECPYCRGAQETIHKLRADYPEGVKIVFKHFPLGIHPHAAAAAKAAYCAAEQGRFWPVHDALFAAPSLSDAAIERAVTDAGVDRNRFDQCVASDAANAAVARDRRSAALAGITGTPSYIVNGRVLRGGATYQSLHDAIANELSVTAASTHQSAARSTEK